VWTEDLLMKAFGKINPVRLPLDQGLIPGDLFSVPEGAILKVGRGRVFLTTPAWEEYTRYAVGQTERYSYYGQLVMYLGVSSEFSSSGNREASIFVSPGDRCLTCDHKLLYQLDWLGEGPD
jgi:hypothetical protein